MRIALLWTSLLALLSVGACSPEGTAGGVGDQALAISGGADTGSIHEESDVYDAGIDIDPDLLKSHQTCAQVLQCASEFCKTKAAPGCDSDCVDEASKAATAAYGLYGECRNKACAAGECKGSGDPNCVNACMLKRCSRLLFRCNAEGGAGAQPCASMVGCHKQCADAAKARKKEGKASQEFSCLNGCYAALSGDAQQRYDQWASCYAHSAAADPYAACLVPLLTCGANGGAGDGSCGTIANCVAGCEQQTGKAHDHQSCIGLCYGGGDLAAQAAWRAVLQCRLDLSAGASDSQSCAAALTTCAAPVGDLSCKEVMNCVDLCHTKGDTADCPMSCLAQAETASAVDYSALLWCGVANCDMSCQGKPGCMATCQAQNCADELAACTK